MNWRRGEEKVDMTRRLRQVEQLLAPVEHNDAPPTPLLAVERHMGRMYVAGHEPHFRPVTLLAPAAHRGVSSPLGNGIPHDG